MDDGQIVDLFLLRDEAAIEQSAAKYGARLRALAFGIAGDRGTAVECENDAYWSAWNAIPPHEPRSYLYAFLARITRHLALDRCRAGARLKRSAQLCELSVELEQCIPAPDDTPCRAGERELAETLNAFLAALGEEKRRIFVRRYWYCDSIVDIAKRLAVSESKVKTTLHRCRARLRMVLEQEGYEL